MQSKALKARGLVSFLVFLGFFVMVITGVLLYITPQGRIANWIDWKLFGLRKEDWGAIHALSSILFIISGIFHLVYNWKPFVNYIRDKTSGALKLRMEMGISIIILLVIVLSAVLKIPPLIYIVDFSETVKATWIVNEDYEPPIGHAELLSFEEFTNKTKIDMDKALAELEMNDIVVENTEDQLGEIALANGTSPMEIFLMIKKYKSPAQETK